MTIGLKNIVAAVNLVCLFVTLIYPNDATPISLLPCWITTGTWLYNRLSSFSGKKTKALALILPLAFLTLCAAISFCIGFACDYIVPESLSYPYYAIKSDAIIPVDFQMSYALFQIFVFVVCLLFSITEIIFEFVGNNSNAQKTSQKESTKTPAQLVNEI